MPRIFDNIGSDLLTGLQETLAVSNRSDFCVGYFNLRGWRHLVKHVDQWKGGKGSCCRLLVGMLIDPGAELRLMLRRNVDEGIMDNQAMNREKQKVAREFKNQLTLGVPTNDDESVLRRLARQLRNEKVYVKVFLCHPLHAKLYLAFRNDPNTPIVGFLGSSNLTMAGLSQQGELNIDVVDTDSTTKLSKWFDDRWNDRCCLDISLVLAEIIEESWAGEELTPPYHVYLKMAYHLSQEARSGLSEFSIPSIFGNTLFEYQIAAVKIAARHLHKRRGVLIGDVVGLGKSLMATALAKIFEEDFGTETLIICPKNLVEMWKDYVHGYRLHAEVLPVSMITEERLQALRRYRVVLIDESHNLRNPAGVRYQAIRSYIERNDSSCILLSATPYNKEYLDLAAQLGLFIPDDADLGVRPEKHIAKMGGEHNFVSKHQCSVRSIAAFRFSEEPDDWKELMRLFMVRRTRGFIVRHYANEDSHGKYLEFSTGEKSYFPIRVPRTVTFSLDDSKQDDPYARLYSDAVVDKINSLKLPRYGLANYIEPSTKNASNLGFASILADLSKAGTRLMGFCRTNLFKRLESSGHAFLNSLERHILRNHVFLYAIENGLEIPLGSQDADMLTSHGADEDIDHDVDVETNSGGGGGNNDEGISGITVGIEFRSRAIQIYSSYAENFRKRFKWIPSDLFTKELAVHLLEDANSLSELVAACGQWNPETDSKLAELVHLVQNKHGKEKILVFSQFADTARYLKTELASRGIGNLEVVTGNEDNPTRLAWRFSPKSNNKMKADLSGHELRVLISTDVLSEGQNLQDCAIVINYDIPWAIIRLIQRVGRVDRIGQESSKIRCYSFLPAEGVERLIKLRARVRKRLRENAEVIGADETFFGDEEKKVILDLYHEKSGVLDEDDQEVDLASYAWQIWKNATSNDPGLLRAIEAMPDVTFATKRQGTETQARSGVLVYTRTPQNNDVLAWVDESGDSVTQSQQAILMAARCEPNTKALARLDAHHKLTEVAVEHIEAEEKATGGSLGRSTGARYKTYSRLKQFRSNLSSTRDLLLSEEFVLRVDKVIEEIYQHPLHAFAKTTLNRQLKAGISDEDLIDLVLRFREEGRLHVAHTDSPIQTTRIICSMGIRSD